MHNSDSDEFSPNRHSLVSLTVIVSLIVSSIVALLIVFAALYIVIFLPESENDTIRGWGGIIIGYYFGSSNVIILLLGVKRARETLA